MINHSMKVNNERQKIIQNSPWNWDLVRNLVVQKTETISSQTPTMREMENVEPDTCDSSDTPRDRYVGCM